MSGLVDFGLLAINILINTMRYDEINDGHYHELLDRTHVAACTIDEHLVNHPLSLADIEIREHLENALDSLMRAYQVIGNKTP
jgi:hypothetical protein